MQTFTDNAHRRWSLEITGNALKRVRKNLGLDLTELEKGEPPLAMRLETDVILQVDVLYALLEPDATRLGLTDEEFGEGLGPEGLRDGQEALAQALSDFFRRLGRLDQLKVLTTQTTFIRAAIARSLSRLEKIDIDGLLNSLDRNAEAKLEKLLAPQSQRSGTDLTNSAASSESIPIPSLSDP